MAWSSSTTAASSWAGIKVQAYQPPVSSEPVLVGYGPPECSSCTALSVLPDCIYDVNGYYRDLGVSPRATRRELREAYQSKDGQSSVRLTYVFKQLLNPETRFAYDCTPLGEVFLDDYVREALSRKVREEMSRRMADLADAGIDLSMVDPDSLQRDVAAGMGYQYVEDEEPSDTPSETVDGASIVKQDSVRPAKFEFSYYLWALRPRQDEETLGRLAEWQRLLVSALSGAGRPCKFAVGLHGKEHRWVQARVGYRTVFFLNQHEAPTEELAAQAVSVFVRNS